MTSSFPTLRIRRATLDDAAILLLWRNDPETRRQSRTSTPVEREEHMRWLASSLANTSRTLCIVEAEGESVGTVRGDVCEDGSIEISYTVAPLWRGKGLSKPMVLQFVKEFFPGKKLLLQIKKGHTPSESVARALDLKPAREIVSEDPSDLRPMVEWR